MANGNGVRPALSFAFASAWFARSNAVTSLRPFGRCHMQWSLALFILGIDFGTVVHQLYHLCVTIQGRKVQSRHGNSAGVQWSPAGVGIDISPVRQQRSCYFRTVHQRCPDQRCIAIFVLAENQTRRTFQQRLNCLGVPVFDGTLAGSVSIEGGYLHTCL